MPISVPNNFEFSLQNVRDSVYSHDITVENNFQSCVDKSVSQYYDVNYNSEIGLKKFRNYTPVSNSEYSITINTGEKYYCYPYDNSTNYLILSVQYIGNISDINGQYYPQTSYNSKRQDTMTTGDSFYRCMAKFGNYQSIWIKEGQSNYGESATIIKRFHSDITKTVYICIMADNYFNIYKNNNAYIISGQNNSNLYFRNLHIFPITLDQGYTELKFVGIQHANESDNALGVLVLDNTIEQILGTNYNNNDFVYLPQNQWNILYTSNSAITDGVYFNYGTTTINLTNYLGITPSTDAPPSIISSWLVQWGDGTQQSGTGSSLPDLQKQYSTTGIKTVNYYVYLTNSTVISNTINITVQ